LIRPARRSRRARGRTAPSRVAHGYLRIRLRLSAAREEDAAAACREAGSLGVSGGATDGRVRRTVELSAWFPDGQGSSTILKRVKGALAGAGIDPRTVSLRAEKVPDRDWVVAWQQSLRPMRIGRRFLVVPEGCRVPARGDRILIRVRFGQAFGTGEHATTRLSLRLLESSLRPGCRVIDLGTGSGILAIACRRLGAARVEAVDDDPVALRVARANLRDNGLHDEIRLRRGDAGRACRGGRFDLAVVNIGATTIERILPDISASLRPGGQAILTGLLVEDEKGILSAASRFRLRSRSRLRSRPWSALLVDREPVRGTT